MTRPEALQNPSARSALRIRLAAFAGWLLAAAFLLVAGLTLAGRILVGQLAGSEILVADELGRHLGLEVELGRLDGRLSLLHPVVEVSGVRMAPPGEPPALTAERVEFEIDLLRSLLARSVVPAALVLEDVEVALERTADGHLGLRGGVVGPQISLADVLEFFHTAGFVEVRSGRLHVHQAGIDDAETLALSGLLRRERGETRGRLDLGYHPAGADVEAPAALHYGFRGNPFAGAPLRGGFQLVIHDLVISEMLADILADVLPVGVTSGSRLQALEISGAARPGSGLEMDTRLEADRLELADGTEMRDVGLVARAVGLGAENGGLDVQRFVATLGGESLALDDLAVRWRRDGGARQIEFAGAEFDSAPLLELLGATVDLPDPAVHWIGGLDPRGTVRSARLLLEPHSRRFALAARIEALHLDAFGGAPAIGGADAEMVLFEGGGWIVLDGGPVGLHFPDVFPAGWEFDRVRGRIDLGFSPGVNAVRGSGIELAGGGVQVRGTFSLHLPQDPAERSLGLMIGIEESAAGRTAEFLPARMSPTLRGWLVEAVRDGVVREGGVVLSGPLHPAAGGGLRPELFFEIADGTLAFDPLWPVAGAVDGRLQVERDRFVGRLHGADLGGVTLRDVRIEVPGLDAGARELMIRGAGEGPAAHALGLLEAVPVTRDLVTGEDAWQAEGAVALEYAITLPLDGRPLEQLDLDLDMSLTRFALPPLALESSGLEGRVTYRHPGELQARALSGELFSGPVHVDLSGGFGEGHDGLRLDLEGRADAAALALWTAVDTLAGAAGVLDYRAQLDIGADMAVALELEGSGETLTTGLPAPLGRAEGPLRLRFDAAPDQDWLLDFSWGAHAGTFRMGDRELLAGALGFGVPPPPVPESGFSARGQVESVDLAEWTAALAAIERTAVARGRPPTRRRTAADLDLELAFEATHWGSMAFGPAGIRVRGSTLATEIDLTSEPVSGQVVARMGEPLEADLTHLYWPPPRPQGEAEAEGPELDPERVVAMNVRIGDLRWEGVELGAVAFALSPEPELILVEGIEADLRGLILGPDDNGLSRLEWRFGPRPQTRFRGRVSGVESTRILENWGLAPTLDAEVFQLDLDLAWPGGPLELETHALDGRVALEIERGRFVQVESGTAPLRVVGLFNFAAIARRMRLDFTDLYKRGMAFDEIEGVLDFDSGLVRTTDPLRILGPGSSFRIAAELDLVSQRLDGDIVVTLPVSRNLPWYAAYAILLANPVTGAGVFVAERVFRDQIDRFSSARYQLRGDLDQPEVTFVSIFADQVDLPVRLPPEEDPDLDWLLDDPFFWPEEYPQLLPLETDS